MYLLLALALATLVAGEEMDVSDSEVSPVETDYHNKIGIPEAARIKAAEEAMDFDGSRIVGGHPAPLGQFPHQAGLVITLTSGYTSVCGATLVTNKRCITAAHCWRTTNAQARQFVVVLGSLYLFYGGKRVTTNEVELHASYNMYTLINDVAVAKIPWVGYNQHIQPVALATGNYQYTGHWVWASGFGRRYDGQSISNSQYLSYVSLQVITNDACARVYGTSTVRASTLCTATNGGRSTCGGDSGGPLVFYNERDQPVLVGVTSFGHVAGCQHNYPAGFSRVTSFLSWIKARL